MSGTTEEEDDDNDEDMEDSEDGEMDDFFYFARVEWPTERRRVFVTAYRDGILPHSVIALGRETYTAVNKFKDIDFSIYLPEFELPW